MVKTSKSKFVKAATPTAVAQSTVFKQLAGQDEQDVIALYQGYDINTKMAIGQYVRQDQQSGGYTMSQNMNHKLENDIPLNANEQYVATKLDAAMHPIGKDIVLNRGAHQDFLQALGVQNYASMTESQINTKIAGTEYTEKKFVSTAWDTSRNPFMSGPVSGGREVYLNINAPATTKAVIGNPSQTELVLSRSTKYRIKGAHFDGTTAYPRNGGAKPRIVVDVEIIG
jgi:hypothetical protein